MAGNPRPVYLSVRSLSPSEVRWKKWKCWVCYLDDYAPYARRQGPATIAFNGELYWSLESRS
jgi:hypothetical protein